MHMLNVIKTAIITIIISFISGVLLDSYKNFAPRILCTMGKPVSLRINDKKIWAFTLIMRNISNKTIHNLNLNIQGHNDNLKIDEAKINKGLKFESVTERNGYNISIPFLSKNDEFTARIFVESRDRKIRKPIIALRSPEDFKRIDSNGKNGYLATIVGIPKDLCDSLNKRKSNKQKLNKDDKSKYASHNEFKGYTKAFIVICVAVIVVYAGILGNRYYDVISEKIAGSSNNANIQQSEASLGKSSMLSEDTSSSTESTKNLEKNIKSTSSVKADDNKNNVTYTKSAGDTNKDVEEKPAQTKTNKDTKVSENTEAQNKNDSSDDNKKETEVNKKNADSQNNKNNDNKKANTENPKKDNSSSDNKKAEQKGSNNNSKESDQKSGKQDNKDSVNKNDANLAQNDEKDKTSLPEEKNK